jgi:hypothetical protein
MGHFKAYMGKKTPPLLKFTVVEQSTFFYSFFFVFLEEHKKLVVKLRSKSLKVSPASKFWTELICNLKKKSEKK